MPCRIEAQLGSWVFILFGLELLHQIHFLISEHWAAYNQFWVHKVWGRSGAAVFHASCRRGRDTGSGGFSAGC